MNAETIDKLADFLVEHNKYHDKEIIKEYIVQHEKFGTIDWGEDTEGNIVAIVRWNVNGTIFEILDFSIREDWRRRGLGRNFILRGLMKFPDAQWLEFKRGVRGDERIRKVSINHILKKEWF